MGALRIAVSGKSGCGNTTVSRLLAQRLGVRLINYTFHTMAEEQGVSFDQMCRMAESDDSWDRYLDRKQVERAMEGSCVLGSRLAIWVLHAADIKVYLTASPETRAKRIQTREGGSLEEVRAATDQRDQRDRARYLRIYGIDIDAYGFADMIIDTERWQPPEIVERIVAEVARRAPAELPQNNSDQPLL
ncbi:MAG: (d)CMP kinase [Alkalispirochaeta sp.]